MWKKIQPSGKKVDGLYSCKNTVYDGSVYYINSKMIVTKYDPVKNSYTRIRTKGSKPHIREDFDLCCSGDYIYLYGGNKDRTLSSDFYRLDLKSEKWKQLHPSGKQPPPTDRHTLESYNDELYLFGGHTVDQKYSNELYKYSIKDNKWELLSSKGAPIPRYFHSCITSDDKLFILFGRGSNGAFGDCYYYDLKEQTWVQPKYTGIFPAARWAHSVSVGSSKNNDGKIILFGGWNGTWCFNDVHVLDLVAKRWQRLKLQGVTPVRRAFHITSVVDNVLYLFGGRNGLQRMNELYMLEGALGSSDNPDKAKNGINNTNDQDGTTSNETESKTNKTDDAKKIKYKLEDFEMLETLGTGSFGRVRFSRHKPTGKYYAIKILKKCEIIRLKQVDHINNEKNILGNIDHPFTVNMIATFQDTRYLYICMEYVVGGEFFTHLRKNRRFSNEMAKFYAAQVVLIFQYIHSKNIVYRDLKPENLLLDQKGYLKITDFGFAKKIEYRTWTLCGTPEYLAPEILLNKGHGLGVDHYALGILIYEMLAGNPPFIDPDPMGIYTKILEGKVRFPRYFNKSAKDLIKKLLTSDITKRLGNLKNGIDDIKKHKWFADIDWGALYNYKYKSPLVPEVSGIDDTHNFEKYPESMTLAQEILLENDPFKDF